MNSESILVGITIAVGIFLGYRTALWLSAVAGHFSAIAKVCLLINKNRESIGKSFTSFEDIITSANKINQDHVDINLSLVKEVIRMREAVEAFSGIMAPPKDVPVEETTPVDLEESFRNNYTDLLNQGLDPRAAELKAAEWELERISEGRISETLGIGA